MIPPTLGNRTSSEVLSRVEADAGPYLLVIPLGATEQHGPHLPLDTDSIIAQAWADAVADRLDRALAAPVVAYGSSGEHQDFPGTLSIGSEALTVVLIELVRSARSWVDRVALLSGHAGNQVPLRRAVEQLRHEGHDVSGHLPRWPDRTDIDPHAGRTETSLMLHLAPDRVRADRAEAGSTAPLGDLLPALRRGGVSSVSANGVLGDPSGADADLGRELFDDLVERTATELS